MPEASLPAPASTDVPAVGTVDAAVTSMRERRAASVVAVPAAREISEPATLEKAGATEPESTSQEDDAAAADQPPPGETEDDEPAGEPSLDPPRSLTDAEKKVFDSLPRDIQKLWLERETERETYYRKGHDEAAKATRAAQATSQAAEQARQQYEQALPALYERMYGQFQAQFGDIKTAEDITLLRETDPNRWMAYRDAKEQAMQVHQEANAAHQRQAQQDAQNYQRYIAQEDQKFLAAAPEFKDAKKADELAHDARVMFGALGFTTEELGDLWDGGRLVSLRDSRIQLALRKAVLYDRAQKALKAAQPKPIPPVQKSGNATSRGEIAGARIQELRTKVNKTGSVDDAVALMRAKRAAQGRAAS